MNKLLLFVFFLHLPLVATLPNLEESAVDFVLESKQIKIDGYETAFNPSIVRWQNKVLLSFRIRNQNTKATNEIGLTFLDSEFNPMGEPQKVPLPFSQFTPKYHVLDPRLISVGEKLYLIFACWSEVFGSLRSRMYIAELVFEEGKFYTKTPEALLYFDGMDPHLREKNWVPFDYNQQLLLSYSIRPHLVFQPLQDGSGICKTIARTNSKIEWPWGILRGGTPALKIGNEYLAFFHSAIVMSTAHSDGENIRHYFMGGYTFNAKPPFELTRISSKPIIGKGFYSGPRYDTWKPLRVVFPSGFLYDEKFVWLLFGKQDHEIWVTKLDKKQLLDSFVKVKSKGIE